MKNFYFLFIIFVFSVCFAAEQQGAVLRSAQRLYLNKDTVRAKEREWRLQSTITSIIINNVDNLFLRSWFPAPGEEYFEIFFNTDSSTVLNCYTKFSHGELIEIENCTLDTSSSTELSAEEIARDRAEVKALNEAELRRIRGY